MPLCGGWLRAYAKDHTRRGFRPAYHDARGEGRPVNHKKIHRLWREEGLRVAAAAAAQTPRYLHRTDSHRGAGNRVRTMDFPFDVTADGRPIKIVSIIDEHRIPGIAERCRLSRQWMPINNHSPFVVRAFLASSVKRLSKSALCQHGETVIADFTARRATHTEIG
jgi:hypothetical protein